MKENRQNLFIAISVIVSITTAIILIMQYVEGKELKRVELELKKHELDQIKHNV